MSSFIGWSAAAMLVVLGGCTDTTEEKSVCDPNTFSCSSNTLLKCAADGQGYTVEADCSAQDKVCDDKGCVVCLPDSKTCQGANVVQCNKDGTGYLPTPVKTCDAAAGMICDKLICVNACKLAAESRSYVGCEYWAVDLDNAVVTSGSAASQQFAVALSNPSVLTAKVTISINESPYGAPVKSKTVTSRTVQPQGLELVMLPAREVDGSPAGQYDTGGGTAVTPNGYKIESTVPIIAYQFNPLSNVGVFSNDASLLVPTPALTTDISNLKGAGYTVMSWPQTIATTTDTDTNFGEDLRAFLTIVGTRNKTTVQLALSTATIKDKEGKIPAKAKGDTLTFQLEPYDVLNLETGGFMADFTGTVITTDKPVAVFSGSEASDVPDFTTLKLRRCCADHLEHQLFPSSTWGKVFLALKTPSRTDAIYKAGATVTVNNKETEYFRILGVGEDIKVTTNLPEEPQISLVTGKYHQIKVDQDFTMVSTRPIAVGQFVASQEEAGIPSSLPGGDPAFILLPSVEQFRKEYLFLTPNKYAFDYIMVAAPQDAKVSLDGRPLKAGCDSTTGKKLCCTWTPVGKVQRPGDKVDTMFYAWKCQLSFPKIDIGKVPPDNLLPGDQNDGVHRLKSDKPIGLVVYGFDSYVSYGYPGGTNLTLINVK